MKNTKLEAKKRSVLGRKVKKLREEGLIPANVYGKKVKSFAVSVGYKDFGKVYDQVHETGLVDLDVEGKISPVLIGATQIHPVSGEVYHIDFKQVDLNEKVSAEVPVELVGESPAQKKGLGTLVQLVNELEVEAFPADLPEKFDIDVSGLEEVNQSIAVSDIKVGSKVEIKADGEQVIAKIEEPQKEEEVAPVATEEVEGEASSEANETTEKQEGSSENGEEAASES